MATAKNQLNQIASSSDIGPGLLATLAKTVSGEEIAKAIAGLLTATTTQRVGANDYDLVPDHRAREAGVKLYLSYMLGMPVQRSIEIQKKDETDGDALSRLLSSPAAKAAMQRALNESATPV